MKEDDISINNKLFDPSNRNVRSFALLNIQLTFVDYTLE